MPRSGLRFWLFLLLLVCSAAPFLAGAQEAQLRGTVYDAITKESLPGVNIIADSVNGTATDENGQFALILGSGLHHLRFRFIGYAEGSLKVDLKPGETIERSVYLQPAAIELNTAVVSASLYEQRLSDVTVSMEVIPAQFIENVVTLRLEETISLMPGVDVLDGQANIRGGSGYSYGAGSRVMLLLDELPLLSGDVNDVKWSTLPVENIGQVEIIKGASSALYGSAALNGVINLHSAVPGPEPSTSVELSAGMYLKPARKELAWWWDRNPLMGNFRFSHMRKSGPLDITLGGAAMADEGYREENYTYYGRLNAGFRYNPKKLNNLTAGLFANFQYQSFSDFLIWQDADSGAWLQNPQAVSPNTGNRFNIDPFVKYFDKRQGVHSLNTRYYLVDNHFKDDPDKENGSDFFYGEYRYQREFRIPLHWTLGAAASYTLGRSALYGDHEGSTMALFSQFDYRWRDRLSLSLGLRWERYTLDRTDKDSRPVIRTGINYRAAPSTFIRASYGQGYRYPSMAEKYTATSLGSLNIFPNPLLEPETGWSAELGIKQGYRFGSWSGYVDLAAFWTEYQNMMEFTFGVYKPDSVPVATLDHIGFKSLNIGNARIPGVDISLTGQGQAGAVLLRFFAGYTYMDPLDQSTDTISRKILKYRYRHSAKGDLSAAWKAFSAGITLSYQSFIERIDPAFEETILGQEFFPGLKEYRMENDHGTVIVDLRVGWQVAPSSQITVIARNMLNAESMGRPGDIQPPINISVQYLLKI